MELTLYDYCLSKNRPELNSQWHPIKNGGLEPKDVLPTSYSKVWWRCSKGHEWQAEINSRTAGADCPICTERGAARGENDLATTRPEIASRWHPKNNGSLTPQMVRTGSRRKVWWQCAKGHEWQASVCSVTAGISDCPVCNGKTSIPGENDLASLFPQIAAEWHPTKNGGLCPEAVTPYSTRKVWWLCSKGHEYRDNIDHRTAQADGCPYCEGKRVLSGFNDLATEYPDVAAQWHPTMNEGIRPEMIGSGSHKKVWWQCDEGHSWKAFVYSRTSPEDSGCPFCAGKVKQGYPGRYRLMLESAGSRTGEIDEALTI